MKTQILLLLLLSAVALPAQKYGHVWQFGTNAGIDFNSCPPVALTTGSNTGFEGCAAVCDNITGQLLFYTNSDKVWNSQHAVMQNGSLIGSTTLSQVLIVKKPLSNSIYYIFTTKVQGTGFLNFRYHTVDMSLNGGLGSVVNTNNVITTATITEQVAATYHSNGTDIWVMTHEYGSSNFMAYLVTSSGVSPTAVVSSVGPAHVACNSNTNARGEIKFSPNGLKLAFNGNGEGTNVNSDILTLFDFNNSTGVVSNPLNLPFIRGEFGLSFSPDNSKLYGATWKALNFTLGNYNYLYQFDLSSGNPATIASSRTRIDSFPLAGGNPIYGSIKIGPDGKIYVAKYNSTFLGVINSPNLPGVSCNYVSNGFYLGGRTCQYGLNNYIEYINYTSAPSVSVTSTPSLSCPGQPVILSASGANSYTWNPGSQNGTSISVTPTVTTSYTVSGTSTLTGCSGSIIVTQTVSACTGFDSQIMAGGSSLEIIPNPSRGEFIISTSEDLDLKITNWLGQVVKTIRSDEMNGHKILVSGLEGGIYFISDDCSRGSVRKKMIIFE